jgi:aryl-alcohol dehydrogenase-like predicted oxidoreductase
MSALDASLGRLGLKTIDLYYVHYPLPLIDVGVFADGLVEAVKSGKARAVGVANFNANQMRRIADHLSFRFRHRTLSLTHNRSPVSLSGRQGR